MANATATAVAKVVAVMRKAWTLVDSIKVKQCIMVMVQIQVPSFPKECLVDLGIKVELHTLQQGNTKGIVEIVAAA